MGEDAQGFAIIVSSIEFRHVLFGFFNMPFKLIEDLVQGCNGGKVHFNAFADFRILELFSDAAYKALDNNISTYYMV